MLQTFWDKIGLVPTFEEDIYIPLRYLLSLDAAKLLAMVVAANKLESQETRTAASVQILRMTFLPTSHQNDSAHETNIHLY